MVFVPADLADHGGGYVLSIGLADRTRVGSILFICGYIALYSLEELSELRGWAKAIWFFLSKREKFLRLYVERRELREALREFDS
jgi:hypothetical protein